MGSSGRGVTWQRNDGVKALVLSPVPRCLPFSGSRFLPRLVLSWLQDEMMHTTPFKGKSELFFLYLTFC